MLDMYSYEMMHKAWKKQRTGPLLFFIVKFQGHTGQNADFDPDWAFPECNFSLNSLMAM